MKPKAVQGLMEKKDQPALEVGPFFSSRCSFHSELPVSTIGCAPFEAPALIQRKGPVTLSIFDAPSPDAWTCGAANFRVAWPIEQPYRNY